MEIKCDVDVDMIKMLQTVHFDVSSVHVFAASENPANSVAVAGA